MRSKPIWLSVLIMLAAMGCFPQPNRGTGSAPRIISSSAYVRTTVDATQADAMLKLLEHCGSTTASSEEIAKIMALPGTHLIIAQQNVSRRITAEQYRQVLTSACKGTIANIEPSEPGARAQKGVQGLTEDVAPSIIWGREHIAELQKWTATAKNSDLDNIVPLAEANLPERIELSPKLYLVMGGRAGAAAFEDGIYLDLLSNAWRSRDKPTPMTQNEIVGFFAHETHHIGYGMILDRKREKLHLSVGKEQAWKFLKAILMEGSATLLINAQGNWATLASQEHIKPDLERLSKLLPETEMIFHKSLSGGMNPQEYDSAVSDFFGEGYHAVGAKLLYVIQQALGKEGVLKVMENPTNLLRVYNQCAEKIGVPFRFEKETAEGLASLGATP